MCYVLTLSDLHLYLYSYTGVVPIASTGHTVADLIIGGKHDLTIYSDANEAKTKVAGMDGWGNVMIDLLITPEWTAEHTKRGRIDWKYVLYGDVKAGPLSLRADVKKTGKVRVRWSIYMYVYMLMHGIPISIPLPMYPITLCICTDHGMRSEW